MHVGNDFPMCLLAQGRNIAADMYPEDYSGTDPVVVLAIVDFPPIVTSTRSYNPSYINNYFSPRFICNRNFESHLLIV